MLPLVAAPVALAVVAGVALLGPAARRGGFEGSQPHCLYRTASLLAAPDDPLPWPLLSLLVAVQLVLVWLALLLCRVPLHGNLQVWFRWPNLPICCAVASLTLVRCNCFSKHFRTAGIGSTRNLGTRARRCPMHTFERIRHIWSMDRGLYPS